jgi:hypothetical protein
MSKYSVNIYIYGQRNKGLWKYEHPVDNMKYVVLGGEIGWSINIFKNLKMKQNKRLMLNVYGKLHIDREVQINST